MSPAPRPVVSAINGLLLVPEPVVNCRTRRETKLTRILGLPTFARACFANSLFMIFTERAKVAGGGMNAIEKFLGKMALSGVAVFLSCRVAIVSRTRGIDAVN